ncbi:hypothetical protein [Salinivibrio costicola]|uniref:hypothetical protein n=1 Tax=Salinivibrio costicola TaxID=51367 RepID=UPI003F70791E
MVLQALIGMAISFVLLLIATLGAQNSLNQWPWLALALMARVVYGLTVAGMVPANQHWAVLLVGEARRMQAITSISIGLSLGRLAGPLIATLVISLMPHREGQKYTSSSRVSQWLAPKAIWPYMGYGLTVCAAIALLQYNLTLILHTITEWSASKVSQMMSYLLTLKRHCNTHRTSVGGKKTASKHRPHAGHRRNQLSCRLWLTFTPYPGRINRCYARNIRSLCVADPCLY